MQYMIKRDSAMSPTQFHHDHHHPKREIFTNGLCPTPLKINKDSHFIKKSSPPSSSSSTTTVAAKPPHRHPVIIYTHSPKVIHTHPRDFMALVQKLTGFSSENPQPPKQDITKKDTNSEEDLQKNLKNLSNNHEDNDCSSVLTTDENCSTNLGDNMVQLNNSTCTFVPPLQHHQIFDPSHNFNNIPIFAPNNSDFFCPPQPFYNYSDSLFLMPNMRSSVSSSTLEGLKEFPEF